MTQAQFCDVTYHGFQPRERDPYQFPRTGFAHIGAGIKFLGCRLVRFRKYVGCGAVVELTVALVTGNGIQPRPEPVGVTQVRKPGNGDDECVPDRVPRFLGRGKQ